MKHAKEFKRGAKGKSIFFFTALAFLMVLSLLLPLRPTESLLEKRKLKEFPELSPSQVLSSDSTLLSGAYFQDIDAWFSDTFPFRDVFFQVNDFVRKGYGLKETEIHGSFTPANEIPDDFFTGE